MPRSAPPILFALYHILVYSADVTCYCYQLNVFDLEALRVAKLRTNLPVSLILLATNVLFLLFHCAGLVLFCHYLTRTSLSLPSANTTSVSTSDDSPSDDTKLGTCRSSAMMAVLCFDFSCNMSACRVGDVLRHDDLWSFLSVMWVILLQDIVFKRTFPALWVLVKAPKRETERKSEEMGTGEEKDPLLPIAHTVSSSPPSYEGNESTPCEDCAANTEAKSEEPPSITITEPPLAGHRPTYLASPPSPPLASPGLSSNDLPLVASACRHIQPRPPVPSFHANSIV